MSDPRFTRVGKAHPNCCKAEVCEFMAEGNREYCPIHKGDKNAPTINPGLKQYVLSGPLAARANVFVNSPGLKSLNEEIALTRAVLEMVLTKIQGPDDATLFIERIDRSVNTISKLILDTQKVEEKNKELLDRATVFGIGDKIIAILVDHLPQELLLDVSDKIYEAITTGIGQPV